MKLPATLDQCASEPPTSLLSRLAFLNGLTALELCGDFGLDFQGIVDGAVGAVVDLADLAGLPAADLMEFAFVRGKGFDYQHRGEMFVRDMLRRRRVMVCPECLRADVAANSDPDRDPEAVVFNRADWCIEAITTCAVHRLGLVEVASADEYALRHDFARLVAPSLPRLDALASSAVRRQPTGLEEYVSARLAKRSAPIGLLDTLEIHVAITLCQLVGAMKLYGRTVDFDRLDEGRRRLGGHAGFLVLRGGAEAFTGFLEDIQHDFSMLRKGGLYGPAAAIGSLFKLLKTRRQRVYPRHAAFAPVRSFVTDFVLNSFALRPGEEFLGKVVDERRLHSVWSLADETGLNPHRLKKVLHGFGVIGDRQMAYSFHKIAFDARAGLEAVELERQSLAIPEVAKHIGATAADAARLARDGFIRPVAMPPKSKVRPRYAISELDAFVGSILRNAKPVAARSKGQISMKDVPRRTSRPTAVVLRHLLDGHLKSTFRLKGKHGYAALLLDLAEVMRIVRDRDHGGLKLRQATVAICTSEPVARALIKEGYIKTVVVRNPVTRQEQVVVMPAEVEAFRKTFISAWLLARERGMHPTTVRRAMERAGIEPAFAPLKIGGWIYRREDVPASLEV
ncbi:TniQ family protein [Bradyrhizobium jicamae]|uniref:TniQ family protein n=1 Tax=Bradyrhizobium jicamae TaxID=280332 RepID=UPI001BA819F2|nr:TniQ family protein [Bradyrhizobium jicamae]MBR0752914.1 TniQ family protein [Bradyrhizobium jicamae]